MEKEENVQSVCVTAWCRAVMMLLRRLQPEWCGSQGNLLVGGRWVPLHGAA